MSDVDPLRSPAAPLAGIVTTAQALHIGLTRDQIRHLCRSGRWIRLARGCYLPAAEITAPALHRARVRAAVTSLGSAAFAVLDTAAELHGMAGLRPTTAIHVSVPVTDPRPQRRTNPNLVVHQMTVEAADLVELAGMRVTTPTRTVADVILRAGRHAAVSVLDSALNQGLVGAADLVLIERMLRGRRGAIAARRHLAEANGRAQSPLETRVRLRCVDGRVAPDVVQHEIRDEDGYLLGVADLAWLRARVIAEADGRGPHDTPEAVFADRRRQNLLVNAGWTVLRFTWADTLRADYIPQTVRNAISAASSR